MLSSTLFYFIMADWHNDPHATFVKAITKIGCQINLCRSPHSASISRSMKAYLSHLHNKKKKRGILKRCCGRVLLLSPEHNIWIIKYTGVSIGHQTISLGAKGILEYIQKYLMIEKSWRHFLAIKEAAMCFKPNPPWIFQQTQLPLTHKKLYVSP